MSKLGMPFGQLRSLTQLRILLTETIESLKKSTASPKSDVLPSSSAVQNYISTESYHRLIKLLSIVWKTENKSEVAETKTSDKSVKNEDLKVKVEPSPPEKTQLSLIDFAKEQENELEKALMDWAESGLVSKTKTTEKRQKEMKPLEIKQQSRLSLAKQQINIASRCRFLIKSLVTATSPESQILRLEDLCKHLLCYPDAKGIAIKELALKHVMNLREESLDPEVQASAREALTLLGYSDPPSTSGIRILSIDGGGTRGIMAIEMMRQLEKKTGMLVHEMFDFICGVSTGAILTLLFGGMRMSLDECEDLYKKMSCHVFSQNALLGTSRLLWNHAYYDTTVWEKILRDTYGEAGITEVSRNKNNPKVAAVSAIMNQPLLQAYMFRSYALPYRSHSHYLGGCNHKSWEAIRASAAAPGYFEEYCIDGLAHQDGGLMWNNGTALAIHEAQLLWPKERLSCVVSIGTGRYVPPSPKVNTTSISLKTKLLKILDSATDTEGVHTMLHDLLPPSVYFRLNPYLTEPMTMDETRPEKLQQLKLDAQMYLRKNEHKVSHVATALTRPRSKVQRLQDWAYLEALKRTG